MNSAAVIGRQLRQQQNTGRTSGPLVPPTPGGRGRPRTPSHQPLYPPNLGFQNASGLNSSVSGSGGGFGPGQGPGGEKKKKPSAWEVFRSKVSLRCICQALKALSGGLLLILIGTGMSVIGFYAETFATETVKEGNRTIEILDEERQYHLHNLTYVGPALMGLGGLALVAACVMTCDVKETAGGSKVAPESDKEHHELLGERLPGSLLMGGASLEKLNGPSIFLQNSSPYLRVPQLSPILHHAGSSEFGSGRDEEEDDVMSETITIQLIPNGPASKPTLHDLPLFMTRSVSPPTTIPQSCSSSSGYGAATTTDRNCAGNNSSSSAGGILPSSVIDDYMPSPQDLEISDPDGCSTPRRASLTSMDMELYLSDCPITVRVRVEPKHFASMESDGLSDSDNSEHAGAEGRDLGGDFGSVSLDRDLDDVELELPLLGRCSPQLPFLPHLHNPRHYHSSRTSAETPLLKRDSSNGGRRFPLMRQSAMEGAAHHHGTRNHHHDGRGNDCRT